MANEGKKVLSLFEAPVVLYHIAQKSMLDKCVSSSLDPEYEWLLRVAGFQYHLHLLLILAHRKKHEHGSLPPDYRSHPVESLESVVPN